MAQTVYTYLPYPVNQSLQVGDQVYITNTVQQYAGYDETWELSTGEVEYVGAITAITNISFATPSDNITDNDPILAVKLDIFSVFIDEIPVGSFLFFGKRREANESSMLGYYSEMKFENNSKERAELFSVGAEITQSS